MHCPSCLAENELMIKTKGYGKSYIPDTMECVVHNKQSIVLNSTSHAGSQVKNATTHDDTLLQIPQNEPSRSNTAPYKTYPSGGLRYSN